MFSESMKSFFTKIAVFITVEYNTWTECGLFFINLSSVMYAFRHATHTHTHTHTPVSYTHLDVYKRQPAHTHTLA